MPYKSQAQAGHFHTYKQASVAQLLAQGAAKQAGAWGRNMPTWLGGYSNNSTEYADQVAQQQKSQIDSDMGHYQSGSHWYNPWSWGSGEGLDNISKGLQEQVATGAMTQQQANQKLTEQRNSLLAKSQQSALSGSNEDIRAAAQHGVSRARQYGGDPAQARTAIQQRATYVAPQATAAKGSTKPTPAPGITAGQPTGGPVLGASDAGMVEQQGPAKPAPRPAAPRPAAPRPAPRPNQRAALPQAAGGQQVLAPLGQGSFQHEMPEQQISFNNSHQPGVNTANSLGGGPKFASYQPQSFAARLASAMFIEM